MDELEKSNGLKGTCYAISNKRLAFSAVGSGNFVQLIQKGRVEIMDGHVSHLDRRTTNLAIENNITQNNSCHIFFNHCKSANLDHWSSSGTKNLLMVRIKPKEAHIEWINEYDLLVSSRCFWTELSRKKCGNFWKGLRTGKRKRKKNERWWTAWRRNVWRDEQ